MRATDSTTLSRRNSRHGEMTVSRATDSWHTVTSIRVGGVTGGRVDGRADGLVGGLAGLWEG